MPRKNLNDYFSKNEPNFIKSLELYNKSVESYVSSMKSLIEGDKIKNKTELRQKHQETKKKAIDAFGDNVQCDVQKRQFIHLLKCDKIDEFADNNFNKFEEMYQRAQVGEQQWLQICPFICEWVYQSVDGYIKLWMGCLFRALVLLISIFFNKLVIYLFLFLLQFSWVPVIAGVGSSSVVLLISAVYFYYKKKSKVSKVPKEPVVTFVKNGSSSKSLA